MYNFCTQCSEIVAVCVNINCDNSLQVVTWSYSIGLNQKYSTKIVLKNTLTKYKSYNTQNPSQ